VDLTNSFFCNNIRAAVGVDDAACGADMMANLIFNVISLESGGFSCSSLPVGIHCKAMFPAGMPGDCGTAGAMTGSAAPCNATRLTPADAGNLVVITSPMTTTAPTAIFVQPTTFDQPTTIASDVVITSTAALSFGSGASLTASGSVTIQPGATILFAANVSGTYVLVRGGSLAGTFSAVTAVPPPGCVATEGPPQYTSTTMSVTVTIDCASGGGLSTGAIVGIAVGAAVGGILVAVAIVLLTRPAIRRHDMLAKQVIMQENHYALKQQYA
jgi:hypothetical protein